MTLQRVAAWGLLGLKHRRHHLIFQVCLTLSLFCGLTFAQPVEIENGGTGFIGLTDKATGGKFIVTPKNLTYVSKSGKTWERSITQEAQSYSSALISGNSIVVSIYGESKIKKYLASGKLAWQYSADEGPYIFIYNYWKNQGLLGIVTHGADAISALRYSIISEKDGRLAKTPDERKIIGVSREFFLNVWNQPSMLIDDLDAQSHKQELAEMNILPYSVTNKQGKQLSTIFYTPARKNCKQLKIDIPLEEFTHESLEEYAQANVRGEYIYAHRADQCGKFTYKFHWSDPRNPAPQILQGWK